MATMPINQVQRAKEAPNEEDKICLFAETNYRNQMRRFGIRTDDRRRHMYVIGKTGMGKTTMLENMVLHDIYNGHGVGVVDPHGDFAEKILDFIPAHRINDVVYFNPSDAAHPIGFNVLEIHSEEQKHLVASGLMAVFKKIWPDVWSARMEYILNNVLLALLDSQGSTLLGINRMLSDKKYRKRVVGQIKDPVVKKFWVDEYASWTEKYATEAGSAIQNKIGQFLSASIIRNMVAQVKSTINVREIMDGQKIFIMNLSKGRIGEDSSRLLGGMLITQIQLAAMERVDTLEKDRKDFFLYVDEFQNFATQSFANILSEARKYRLSLIMAHQYIAQLDEEVRDAVFGNVGTIVSFRVGAADAEYLEQEFTPTFLQEDIINLSKYRVFLKLMIDGVASQPFSAVTMAPIGNVTGNFDKVIRVSRERYGKRREEIEDKIARWSGMEISGSVEDIDADEESDAERIEKDIQKKEKKEQKSDTPVSQVKADEKVLALKELLEKKEAQPETTETKETISEEEIPEFADVTDAPSVPSTTDDPDDTDDTADQDAATNDMPIADTTLPAPQSVHPMPDDDTAGEAARDDIQREESAPAKSTSKGQAQGQDTDSQDNPSKKKRRKRKRKKKTSTDTQQTQTKAREDAPSPTDPPKEVSESPPPSAPSSASDTLAPNTPITFDT